MPVVKRDRKRSRPIGGLFAGLALLGVVGVGLLTGYMPLAGASNEGIELARWPIVFWGYAAVLAALGAAVVGWSVWALVNKHRDAGG